MLSVGLFTGSLNLSRVWTAAKKRRNAVEFIWTNSGIPVNYTKWVPGQPYSKTNIDLCVWLSGNNEYRWNDDSCKTSITAVCEW